MDQASSSMEMAVAKVQLTMLAVCQKADIQQPGCPEQHKNRKDLVGMTAALAQFTSPVHV